MEEKYTRIHKLADLKGKPSCIHINSQYHPEVAQEIRLDAIDASVKGHVLKQLRRWHKQKKLYLPS